MVSSGAGEMSIPQESVRRSIPTDDALVTLNIESVPLQSGTFGFISGFETATEKVFGKEVHIVNDRDKHWQLVVRDAKTGKAIDGLGWGSTQKPVQYSKTLGSDYTEGGTYLDARLNASHPAIDPQTGKEFEPKVMTYGEAKESLENAKSSMAIYTPYNDSDLMGAVIGKDVFYKGKHVVDNEAMMEWIAKNCQQWARDEFSKINKPLLSEYLRERERAVGNVHADSEIGNLNNTIGVPPPTNDSDMPEVLKSLADLLETGEELVEVRQDMREDRAERKAKERAERERQAAEEAERIRQQQIADQRRNDERKKTEKKTSETKSTSKPATTQKQTSSGTTASIDFSKLNSLVSQQVSLVRGILSSGKKATSAQHAKFNSLNNQYVSEFNRLKAQIAKVSDPAKRSQYYSKLSSINRRINSELDPLLARGQSLGLFKNL